MTKGKNPKGPSTADTQRMKAGAEADRQRFEKDHPGYLKQLRGKDGHK